MKCQAKCVTENLKDKAGRRCANSAIVQFKRSGLKLCAHHAGKHALSVFLNRGEALTIEIQRVKSGVMTDVQKYE